MVVLPGGHTGEDGGLPARVTQLQRGASSRIVCKGAWSADGGRSWRVSRGFRCSARTLHVVHLVAAAGYQLRLCGWQDSRNLPLPSLSLLTARTLHIGRQTRQANLWSRGGGVDQDTCLLLGVLQNQVARERPYRSRERNQQAKEAIEGGLGTHASWLRRQRYGGYPYWNRRLRHPCYVQYARLMSR